MGWGNAGQDDGMGAAMGQAYARDQAVSARNESQTALSQLADVRKVLELMIGRLIEIEKTVGITHD